MTPDLREPEPLDEPALEPEPEPELESEPEPLSGDVLDPEPPTTETAIARQSTDLVTRAKALIVRDPATFVEAGDFLDTLKTKLRQVEYFFEPDIQRAHAAWKGLTVKRAGFVDPLKEAIAIVSSRYATFAREEKARAEAERKQREEAARKTEEDRLRAEAEAARVEAKRLGEEALKVTSRDEAIILEQQSTEATAQAEQLALEARTVQAPVLPLQRSVDVPKNVSVGENWTYELEDKAALIRAVVAGNVSSEALLENNVYLNRRAKADKDTVRIPGVRFFDKGKVTNRRAK